MRTAVICVLLAGGLAAQTPQAPPERKATLEEEVAALRQQVARLQATLDKVAARLEAAEQRPLAIYSPYARPLPYTYPPSTGRFLDTEDHLRWLRGGEDRNYRDSQQLQRLIDSFKAPPNAPVNSVGRIR